MASGGPLVVDQEVSDDDFQDATLFTQAELDEALAKQKADLEKAHKEALDLQKSQAQTTLTETVHARLVDQASQMFSRMQLEAQLTQQRDSLQRAATEDLQLQERVLQANVREKLAPAEQELKELQQHLNRIAQNLTAVERREKSLQTQKDLLENALKGINEQVKDYGYRLGVSLGAERAIRESLTLVAQDRDHYRDRAAFLSRAIDAEKIAQAQILVNITAERDAANQQVQTMQHELHNARNLSPSLQRSMHQQQQLLQQQAATITAFEKKLAMRGAVYGPAITPYAMVQQPMQQQPMQQQPMQQQPMQQQPMQQQLMQQQPMQHQMQHQIQQQIQQQMQYPAQVRPPLSASAAATAVDPMTPAVRARLSRT